MNSNKLFFPDEFYIQSLFISFIGTLFAVVNAKLLTRTTEPPEYITHLVGIIAATPYFGPVFSYFIVSISK